VNTRTERSLFPLVRHLSDRTTPLLAQTPLTANQLTTMSLVLGLAAAWLLTRPDPWLHAAAGALLVVSYVLDNCDGDIARLKDQCTTFGMHFDTFADWAVHTAFFLALGAGEAARSGDPMWWWMGVIAGAGGTINYLLGLLPGPEAKAATAPDENAAAPRRPATAGQWFAYVFRELFRADFCFLVLVLALAGGLWLLLPAGMIDAQVYWMAQFVRGAREFRS